VVPAPEKGVHPMDIRGRPATRPAHAAILAVVTLAILFARRPDQYLHPYIWVEEGVYTLRAFVERGWEAVFEPLAGYLVVSSKLIDLAAFQLSIRWAPELAVALVTLFTCLVVAAIAFSPTHLRWPFACAIATLLVPSDPEVFAVGTYSYWWAGLLLPLALLWVGERQWLRWLYLIVGGLSSPIIGIVAGLLALRFAFERNRREAVAFIIAATVALAQALAMRAQARAGIVVLTTWPDATTVPAIAQKFIGAFFHADAAAAGVAILAAFALLAWTLWQRLDIYFLLLVATFIGVAVAITVRTAPGALLGTDPFTAGPRYFFYPFVLLSWIAIWLASLSPRPVQAAVAAAFIGSLVLAGPRLSRYHDAFDWRVHIEACSQANEYELPIHYIGSASEMWHVKLTGEQCRSLLARSLF
jgi:hypothetical protein